MRIHDLASVDLHPSTNALSRLPSKRLEAIFVNAAPHSVLKVELASYSSKTFVIDLDRVTGQARDMPIVLLPVLWQVCRESASPQKSAQNRIGSSSSYVLVIQPVCRLVVVNRIYSC